MTERVTFTESSGNIFADLGIDEHEAKNLKFRSLLMTLISKYIQLEGLTQKEAAVRLGVTQPRISDIVHGKIDLFSVGTLVDMLERAGFSIYEKIAVNAESFFDEYSGKTNKSARVA